MPDPILTPLIALLLDCNSDLIGGALWDAMKAGGSGILTQFDKNHDIEKLVAAAWNDSLNLLAKQQHVHDGLEAAVIDLRNYGQATIKPESPDFPHELSIALTFGRLEEIGEPIFPLVRDGLAGSNHTPETLQLLQSLLPPLMLSAFAYQLKQDKQEHGFKGVMRDLLWDIAESNQLIVGSLDPKALAELKDQINTLADQNLPQKFDEILANWEPILNTALAPLQATIGQILKKLDEVVSTQAETIRAQEEVHLGLIKLVTDANQERDSALKAVAEAEIMRQESEEARIRAEETAAQQAARIAELERQVPITVDRPTLIARAYQAVKEGRYIDAVRLAYEAESDDPNDAEATFVLAYALQQRPNGNRNQDLLDAISRYERLSRYPYTEEACPQKWAAAQNNLSIAYRDLATGDRGQNINKAIAAIEATFRVYTEDAFPQNWAAAQNNLGNAYRDLPTRNLSQKLQKAITAYEAALRVRTEETFPEDWAMTQNNLGTAYQKLPIGNLSQNLKKAISCYMAALSIYTEETFPRQWAGTQNNLANAYGELPTGDRSQNLQKAIVACEAALRVYSENVLPQEWAGAQNNLGNAYSQLPTGDRGRNLENAIAAYEAALRVRTQKTFPEDWATTKNNLGVAYSELPTGDQRQNLQKAIAAFEDALKQRTEEAFPQDWAMTQNNLGIAYRRIPNGDREESLENAIAAYEAALRVYTEEAFPQQWATTTFNMAVVYTYLGNLSNARELMNLSASVLRRIGHTQYAEHVEQALAELPK